MKGWRSFKHLHFLAFVATFASTSFAGYNLVKHYAPDASLNLFSGLPYAMSVMFILGCHEMGHYAVSKWWGLKVSPPLFIPMPFSSLGTMGALINVKDPFPNRRALFDIAIAGPWAGLLAIVGVWQFADLSLSEIILRQIYYAATIGVIVTFINLFPFGQLDGGHAFYALTAKISHTRWRVLLSAFLLYGLFIQRTINPFTLAFFAFIFGFDHPQTQNDEILLCRTRKVLALLTLVAFILLDVIVRWLGNTYIKL